MSSEDPSIAKPAISGKAWPRDIFLAFNLVYGTKICEAFVVRRPDNGAVQIEVPV